MKNNDKKNEKLQSRLKKDNDTILKPKAINITEDDVLRDELVEIEDGILMSQSEILDFSQGSDSYI